MTDVAPHRPGVVPSAFEVDHAFMACAPGAPEGALRRLSSERSVMCRETKEKGPKE